LCHTRPLAAILLVLSLAPPPPTELYTLSLHDALPICRKPAIARLHPPIRNVQGEGGAASARRPPPAPVNLRAVRRVRRGAPEGRDRKSTRLNSSHVKISYAVFCLKKKTTKRRNNGTTK